jgi:hypothetical protein
MNEILPDHDTGLDILIVPGAFNDCFEDIGTPYREGAERLRQMGYPITIVHVSGLSSSAGNADIIAEAVARHNLGPSQRLILLGLFQGHNRYFAFSGQHIRRLALRVEAV